MTQRTINPQLIKAAAVMAIQGKDNNPWFIDERGAVCREGIDGFKTSGWQYFNPLQNDGDAFKLGEALEREGWTFRKIGDEFEAYYKLEIAAFYYREYAHEKSSPMRYLKALASQTNIPMFAEVV